MSVTFQITTSSNTKPIDKDGRRFRKLRDFNPRLQSTFEEVLDSAAENSNGTGLVHISWLFVYK